MKSYYFNALRTSDLATYPTGYDRVYDANDRADYHAAEATDGIFATTADACEVYVKSGLVLGVREGYAHYRGYRVHVEGNETVTVSGNCTIVLRWNNTEAVRDFELLAVTALIRTETIYDLPLATVTVSGSTAKLKDARVWSQWTRLPAYYPPNTDEVPLSLWRYIMGLPMTDDEIAEVEGNASLMEIYHNTRPYLAGRYGVKLVGSVTNSVSSYSTGVPDEEDAKFEVSYDALGMLQSDGKTLVVAPGIKRIMFTIHFRGGGFTMIGSGSGYAELRVNGTARSKWTATNSGDTDFAEKDIVDVVDVNEGDRLTVYLYACAGERYGSVVEIKAVRLEVVE